MTVVTDRAVGVAGQRDEHRRPELARVLPPHGGLGDLLPRQVRRVLPTLGRPLHRPLGRDVEGGQPAAHPELPKFRVDPGDLLPQLFGFGLVVLDDLPVGRDQVRPVGQQLLVVLRGRLGGEDGFFGHVPALAALGLPQRLRLPGARQAHRLHRGPARHRDVAEFAGLGVADLHRERADADAVLLRRRPDHVGRQRCPHPFGPRPGSGRLGLFLVVIRRPPPRSGSIAGARTRACPAVTRRAGPGTDPRRSRPRRRRGPGPRRASGR